MEICCVSRDRTNTRTYPHFVFFRYHYRYTLHDTSLHAFHSHRCRWNAPPSCHFRCHHMHMLFYFTVWNILVPLHRAAFLHRAHNRYRYAAYQQNSGTAERIGAFRLLRLIGTRRATSRPSVTRRLPYNVANIPDLPNDSFYGAYAANKNLCILGIVALFSCWNVARRTVRCSYRLSFSIANANIASRTGCWAATVFVMHLRIGLPITVRIGLRRAVPNARLPPLKSAALFCAIRSP